MVRLPSWWDFSLWWGFSSGAAGRASGLQPFQAFRQGGHLSFQIIHALLQHLQGLGVGRVGGRQARGVVPGAALRHRGGAGWFGQAVPPAGLTFARLAGHQLHQGTGRALGHLLQIGLHR